LDPSSFEPGKTQADISGTKMVIDATKKWDYPAVSLPPLAKMREVADNWDAYGLPPLDELKLPRDE
jgi:4-hydroxy-3-polyprenylbenzoate decarboxylase